MNQYDVRLGMNTLDEETLTQDANVVRREVSAHVSECQHAQYTTQFESYRKELCVSLQHKKDSGDVAQTCCTVATIVDWLQSIRMRKDVERRYMLNESQFEVVKIVCDRVCREIEDFNAENVASLEEPLRWAMHGGPGTGKTHVIKFIKNELFEKTLGWKIESEFQIVTRQAVTASLVGGDTIHHAFHIPLYARSAINVRDCHTLQMRWLIIDDINTVDANLLAEVDMKLRCTRKHTDRYACNAHGVIRPFGGINVLCSGDLWQFAPPAGMFLGTIPFEYIANGRRYMPCPSTAHGQSLIWSGSVTGIQGVIELEICERTKDAWLQDVFNEFRVGMLTCETHALLHGLPTMRPASHFRGRVMCGNEECIIRNSKVESMQTLTQVQQNLFAAETLFKECDHCKKERRSKQLVAWSAKDPRFHTEKFINGVAVFETHDIEYAVNQIRAQAFAYKEKGEITWSVAKDCPTRDALCISPQLQSNLQWLKRVDMKYAGLYGLLPLLKNMPVAVTEHIDRGAEKLILRGRIGYIHSWILSSIEKSVFENGRRVLNTLPEVVYVKFVNDNGQDVSWRMPDLSENGVYPVVPVKRAWFLSKGERCRITRKQLPLKPAFAINAHAAQGQTYSQGVIVDLAGRRKATSAATYVALTRVKRREDLLLFRPFPLELFRQGQNQV